MPLWKWNLLVTSIRKSNQLISRDCQFRGSHWKSLKVTFTVLFHFIFNLYHNKPTLYGYFVIKDISFFERLIRWYFDCKLYQCCGPVGCECSPGRSSSLICFQAGKVWRKKNLLSCFFYTKIKDFLDKKAIECVSTSKEYNGYYSTFYLVSKKNGGPFLRGFFQGGIFTISL